MSRTPIKRKDQSEIPSKSDGAAGFAQVPGATKIRKKSDADPIPPQIPQMNQTPQQMMVDQQMEQQFLESNLVKPLDVPVPSGPNQGQSISE